MEKGNTMNKRKERLFLAITLVLCVLLFAERLTGGIFHAVLGMVMTILVIVHVCAQGKKWKYRKASVRVLDGVLVAASALLLLTGILAHPMHGVLIVKILHKLSAVVFVLGIIAHVIQHRKAVG